MMGGGNGGAPKVPGLPGDASWLKGITGDATVAADGTLTMAAGPETDYFNAPPMPGMPSGLANAPALMCEPPAGDWQLAATVMIEHQTFFDAGTRAVNPGEPAGGARPPWPHESIGFPRPASR
jgi:hypothetical protein